MTPLAQISNRNRFSIAFQAPAASHGIGKTEGVWRGLRGFVEKQAGGGGGGAHDSWAKCTKPHVAQCGFVSVGYCTVVYPHWDQMVYIWLQAVCNSSLQFDNVPCRKTSRDSFGGIGNWQACLDAQLRRMLNTE